MKLEQDIAFKKIWIISLIIKILLGVILPLTSDEVYYWVWSHHLQWSYYDHPPFVSWLFLLTHTIEGFLSAVRLPGILLGHLTFFIWYKILKKSFPDLDLKFYLLLFLLYPFTGPATLVVTPDIPMMFFWSLSFYILLKWFDDPKASTVFILGLCLGLGFSSKYLIVLFFPCWLIALVYNKPLIKKINWPVSVLALTTSFLIGSFPVFYWNFNNHFLSFSFQMNHGLGAKKWSPDWPLGYIIGQILLIFPTVIYALRKKPTPQNFIYYVFGLLPLAFFLITSFKGRVEANWTIMAFPYLLTIAYLNVERHILLKRSAYCWFAVFIVALTLIYIPILKPLKNLTNLKDIHRFEDLAAYSLNLKPFYARSYQMAAQLSFLNKGDMVYKAPGYGRIDFYDYLPEGQLAKGQYYIGVYKNEAVSIKARKAGHKVTRRISVNHEFDIIEVEGD